MGEVIQTYFDCMFESDSDKAYQAFHPNARITGCNRGQLQEMDVATFYALVDGAIGGAVFAWLYNLLARRFAGASA